MGYLIAGRLNKSGFPVESKHPAILPINHHISALVLQEIHLKSWNIVGEIICFQNWRSSGWKMHLQPLDK